MSVVETSLNAEALRRGLTQLRLSLSDVQVDKLIAYGTMIQKWNKVYNLTALRSSDEMLTHHLLDSLAAVAPLQRWLEGVDTASPRLLDVGSGAGLPGVIFAICIPELSVSCVDTVAKKASFIKQAAIELKLANLTGIHARVETLAPPAVPAFDVISSRAFASLNDFSSWSGGALAAQGVWLAMKGKIPSADIETLPLAVEAFHVEQLTVPGLDAERCIVWMRKNSA